MMEQLFNFRHICINQEVRFPANVMVSITAMQMQNS